MDIKELQQKLNQLVAANSKAFKAASDISTGHGGDIKCTKYIWKLNDFETIEDFAYRIAKRLDEHLLGDGLTCFSGDCAAPSEPLSKYTRPRLCFIADPVTFLFKYEQSHGVHGSVSNSSFLNNVHVFGTQLFITELE